MSRLLAVRNIKRIAQSIRTNNRRIQSEDGSVDRIGLRSSQYGVYSQYTLYSRRSSSFSACNAEYGFGKTTFQRNYCVVPNYRITHNAQIGLKRVSWSSFHNGKCFSPLSRISQAFSLALSRSYVVIPGIFALMCGNMAFAQTGQNVEYFQPRNTLYMHAEDGHALLISSILSVFEGLVLLVRALYLAILFSPSIAMAPFAEYFGSSSRKRWLRIVRRTLEIAGPAFIKWGQWAATRPDLFPRDLCTELSKLHTKAPEHSFAYTKKTVEKAFGRKISEIFDDFEEVPVASGSIAQIHRASLKYRYRGKQIKPLIVAVKVRHPGVGESIRRDFEIINVVAKISRFIPTLKWLRLDESVQQFAVFMMSQVDLAREAAHLSRFIYNFRRWRDVSFPKPVYPLVHPAVLVETFEQGESVAHYVDELEGHERLKSSLAHIGTHALLKMLLVDNFIHADMHPGNILVRSKSSRKGIFKSKPHVVFLDVGMTAELSKNDRVNLLEFFKAVARRDGETAAKCTLRLSKQQNCPNPQAFIKEVTESFDFWGTPEGDVVHPADCMHQLLEQVRRHRVNVDGNVCTVMVTTLVLEGWQRKLDPDYDVMHTLQTLLLKEDWAKSLTYTIEGLMAP
ncbi:probable serine/threonine-protein kinase abkC [Cynara cardunculus var. scolymus]|uniref:Protein kinase-like domain-containing protein n=1 Tax=Cynara cardunculus var. scolymus TaxID=59895 RepID=A0A103XF46_CYNCS|nr:probable serine/threonine-protein kinase abkC [Cynara cardunculus var. scolymus]KVH89585.1 Protein kinase-like domain-containing protein [Cynara cardunculus var. scolymus]